MLFSLILFFVFRFFDLNLIDALTNVNNLDGYTDDCGSHTRSNDSIQFRHTENSVASNVFVLDRIGEWILAWWILLLCYFFCILYCWLLPSPSHKPSINCDSLLYSFLFIFDSSAKWINTLKCKITRITEMIFYLLLDYTFCFFIFALAREILALVIHAYDSIYTLFARLGHWVRPIYMQ